MQRRSVFEGNRCKLGSGITDEVKLSTEMSTELPLTAIKVTMYVTELFVNIAYLIYG